MKRPKQADLPEETQALLQEAAKAPFVRGVLQVGRYRGELMVTMKWIVSIDHEPRTSRGFKLIDSGQRACRRAVRNLIRTTVEEHRNTQPEQ